MVDDRAYELPNLARLIEAHNQGDDHAEFTAKMREVLSRCSNHIQEHGGAAKGQLTLTIDFAVDAKGVDVAMQAKVAYPKPPVVKDRYFVTDQGDGLTLKNPNKGTLFEGNDLGRRRANNQE